MKVDSGLPTCLKEVAEQERGATAVDSRGSQWWTNVETVRKVLRSQTEWETVAATTTSSWTKAKHKQLADLSIKQGEHLQERAATVVIFAVLAAGREVSDSSIKSWSEVYQRGEWIGFIGVQFKFKSTHNCWELSVLGILPDQRDAGCTTTAVKPRETVTESRKYEFGWVILLAWRRRRCDGLDASLEEKVLVGEGEECRFCCGWRLERVDRWAATIDVFEVAAIDETECRRSE